MSGRASLYYQQAAQNPVNLSINSDQAEKAKALGINLSQAFDGT